MSQAPQRRVVPADVARATEPPAALPLRPADPCCFGPFELQFRERLLLAHGRPTDVRGKALDLLVVLAAHAGQLLTRQQLMDAVWGRLVVEDNNLSVQINALRKVLGAGLITTVPGHGYRFNASLAPPSPHGRLLAQPLPPAHTAPVPATCRSSCRP